MRKIYSFFIFFIIILFVSGCGQLNQNPPDYIKKVVTYKEETDGLMIYFILADASGEETTADGTVTLFISETRKEKDYWSDESTEKEVDLYSIEFDINKTDFHKAKIGQGAFEHTAIIYSMGRIKYSLFTEQPSEMYGKVRIAFQTPDRQMLRGEDTISF